MNSQMTKIETKEQLEEAIKKELDSFCNHDLDEYDPEFDAGGREDCNRCYGYARGTNSPAMIEYISRKSVEMAREQTYTGRLQEPYQHSPDEIVAALKKGLQVSEISKEDAERIEQEALDWKQSEIKKGSYGSQYAFDGYRLGATAEHLRMKAEMENLKRDIIEEGFKFFGRPTESRIAHFWATQSKSKTEGE